MKVTGKHYVGGRKIEDMRLGDIGYTRSWAHSLNYCVTDRPFGTSDTPICRTADGFAFIGPPGATIGKKP